MNSNQFSASDFGRSVRQIDAAVNAVFIVAIVVGLFSAVLVSL